MDNLVSVIMPVYNASFFVTEAIESVLNQDYTIWELIIVNDGSTDDSGQKILAFSDERIKYFKQENKGVSEARNVGLKNMAGDFFCFLDADDFFPSNSIQARINYFKSNPNTDYVDGATEIRNFDLKEIVNTRVPSCKGNPREALCNLDGNCFFGNTWMMRNDLNQKYRFLEGLTHGEDLLFYLEYASSGLLGFTTSTILHYRTGHTSAMSNLEGLENGYRTIAKKMNDLSHITKQNITDFKRKSLSIMFKSYLGDFKLIQAIRVFLTW